MGSSYFGEPNMGNDHRGTTTTRKGKKNSGSEKPKQPQRGLGVAQLEKIRLHGQMGGCTSYHQFHPSHHQLHSAYPAANAFTQDDLRVQTAYSSIPSSSFSYTSSPSSSVSYGFNSNYMMGVGDYERGNIRYNDSQHNTNPTSWGSSNSFLEIPHYMQPTMTRHLLDLQVEDPQAERGKKHRSGSLGSSSQNSELNDNSQELDLELRLSL